MVTAHLQGIQLHISISVRKSLYQSCHSIFGPNVPVQLMSAHLSRFHSQIHSTTTKLKERGSPYPDSSAPTLSQTSYNSSKPSALSSKSPPSNQAPEIKSNIQVCTPNSPTSNSHPSPSPRHRRTHSAGRETYRWRRSVCMYRCFVSLYVCFSWFPVPTLRWRCFSLSSFLLDGVCVLGLSLSVVLILDSP